MKVQYGQSGYFGSSRSVRAVEAEEEGKLPLSRAIPIISKKLGITRKAARELIESVGPCEAHHTSKYANLTDYYDLYDVEHEYKLSVDPLGEEVEEAELCETYGYDGWRWLGPLYYELKNELMKEMRSLDDAYELGLLSQKEVDKVNLYHEANGLRIQHSRNFRQWEAALRRFINGN